MKKSLFSIPLQDLSSRYDDLDEEGFEANAILLANQFATDFELKKHDDWFMGQALAQFIDVANPVKAIASNPRLQGIWILFKYCTRSLLVKKQTDDPNYSSLVPLIPSVYKKYHGKNYSSWSEKDLEILLPDELFKAMTYRLVLDASDIMAFRGTALKGKSAESTYNLYFPKESKLFGTPKLFQHMVCQTWCAHPLNRTKYMILDPSNWDNMPAPLISDNLGL